MALFWPPLGSPWLRFADMLNCIVFSMDFMVFRCICVCFSGSGGQHKPKLSHMRPMLNHMRPMLSHTRPMLSYIRPMLSHIRAKYTDMLGTQGARNLPQPTQLTSRQGTKTLFLPIHCISTPLSIYLSIYLSLDLLSVAVLIHMQRRMVAWWCWPQG